MIQYKTEVINNISCAYNDTKAIKSEITDVMKLQNRLQKCGSNNVLKLDRKIKMKLLEDDLSKLLKKQAIDLYGRLESGGTNVKTNKNSKKFFKGDYCSFNLKEKIGKK